VSSASQLPAILYGMPGGTWRNGIRGLRCGQGDSLPDRLVEWMTMEPEIAGVIRIFNSLSTKQQDEAIQTLKEYFNTDSRRRQRLINDSQPGHVAKRVNLGPVNGVCPYCGR